MTGAVAGVSDRWSRSRRRALDVSGSSSTGREPRLLDPLDHQLGDAVAAVHLVVGVGVGVDEEHLELVAVAGSRSGPGVLRQVTPWRRASPLRGCTNPA